MLVSGYVSILLGRARASEDVDVIIQKIDFSTFQDLYHELKKNNYYCPNADEDTIIYYYLSDNLAVRFAQKNKIIPNVVLRWVKHKFEKIALEKSIIVKLSERNLKISPLELQIAFKKEVLKSPKDLEDARHIEKVSEGYLDTELMNI